MGEEEGSTAFDRYRKSHVQHRTGNALSGIPKQRRSERMPYTGLHNGAHHICYEKPYLAAGPP